MCHDPIVTRDQFLRLAGEYKLSHIANEVLSTALPAVRVLKKDLRPPFPEGETFVGGMPRPTPKDWPRHENVPLAFLGQVASFSVPPDVCPVPLPAGILQFFAPSTAENHNHDPCLDCGRVLFVDSGVKLSQSITEPCSVPGPHATSKTAPILSFLSYALRVFKLRPWAKSQANRTPSQKLFPKRSFEWEAFPSLYARAPDLDGVWLPETTQRFDFDYDADETNYFNFRRAVLSSDQGSLCAQMFGFADALQEDMQPTVNTFAGNPSLKVFRDWILLFALHASGGAAAPEAACYYYWIHRDDLTNARFEEVWLCIQYD